MFMTVNVINTSEFPLPVYAHYNDAGLDLKANIDEPITIRPGERVLISTGIHTNIPYGYYVEIKPRSGLAYKQGLMAVIGVIEK